MVGVGGPLGIADTKLVKLVVPRDPSLTLPYLRMILDLDLELFPFPLAPPWCLEHVSAKIIDLEKQVPREEPFTLFCSLRGAGEMKNVRTKTNLMETKITRLLILKAGQHGYELGDKNGKRLA